MSDVKKDEYETEADMEEMNLDEEEKDLLSSYNRSEWQSVPLTDEMLESYKKAAENTQEILSKHHEITVNISGGDLIGIQGKAFEQGVHYKALIAAVLHKYATGKLVDKA